MKKTTILFIFIAVILSFRSYANTQYIDLTAGDTNKICLILGGCDEYTKAWIEAVISQKPKIFNEDVSNWSFKDVSFINLFVSESQMFNKPNWSVGSFSKHRRQLLACNGNRAASLTNLIPSYHSNKNSETNPSLKKNDCVLLIEKSKLVNPKFIEVFINYE